MANTVTRYNPQTNAVPIRSAFDRLLENSFLFPSAFNGLFQDYNQGTMMPANLIETGEHYIVQLALPGVDDSKLDINITERTLRVHGVYSVPEQWENANWIWRGLPQGEFTQSFTLPAQVMGDGAEATYTDGILSVQLPKAENAKVKTVPVKKTTV